MLACFLERPVARGAVNGRLSLEEGPDPLNSAEGIEGLLERRKAFYTRLEYLHFDFT